MRKRSAPKLNARPPRPVFTRRVLAITLTILVAAGLIFSLGKLGGIARDHLGPRDRYRVSFSQIECETPPGTDRSIFLSEVRYVSNCPDTFQLLDPELTPLLTAAFTAHPWVESVEGVEREAPSVVRVKLRFRTPVMSVTVQSGNVRFVDSHGVLLPVTERTPEVAELATVVADTETPAGKVWTNATVRRAIELVNTYHPRRLEKLTKGWKLTGPDGKVFHVNG